MRRRSEVRSRTEVSEKISEQREEMREKESRLDVVATDKETVESTLESLSGDGTAEGIEQIEAHIERAEDVTVETFEREDQDLERLQDETTEHQEELHEQGDSSEADAENISDAGESLDTEEAREQLARAEDEARRDKEFLESGSVEQCDDVKSSETEQEAQRRRIQTRRRR